MDEAKTREYALRIADGFLPQLYGLAWEVKLFEGYARTLRTAKSRENARAKREEINQGLEDFFEALEAEKLEDHYIDVARWMSDRVAFQTGYSLAAHI